MEKSFTRLIGSLLSFLVTSVLLCTAVFAQERTISGIIKSAEDGVAVAGANVVVKGTTIGTITDATGAYSLTVTPDAKTLVFSFIGLTTQEVEIGTRSVLDVMMASDAKQLSEIVTTAFGLEKEKKALGYSVQEVKGDQLAKTPSQSVINNLSGRISGLQVSTNAVPGGSPEFVIRGFSSVGGNNQPLVVVDGVPIAQTVNSRNLTSSSDAIRNDGNFSRRQNQQYGGGISEIDPNNIASISILKGPTAAALYGSRAANGVILVTTKSGAAKKGIGAEVSLGTTFEQPLVKPKFQNTYGGGSGYTWYSDGWSGTVDGFKGSDGTDESWGSPMDGRLVRQWWTGKETAPLVPQPDNWEQFWETGRTMTANVAVTGNSDNGSFRLSIGQLKQDGIVYNNNFRRDNFRLNASHNFTKKLKISGAGEYIKSGSDNRGYLNASTFIWHHRHVNFDQLRDYKTYEDVHIQPAGNTEPPNWQHQYFTNPFFEQEVLVSPNDKNRFLGNIALTYEFNSWLSLMARTGTDFWTDTRIVVDRYARTAGYPAGSFRAGRYSEEVLQSQESNSDFILKAEKEFTHTSITLQAGGIHRTNYYKSDYARVNDLAIDGVYNLGNAASPNLNESALAETEMNSFFGSATVGYKNFVFFDLTARNDWSSTLPEENNSYFYPSASLSAVITDMIPSLFNKVLSFAKVRASWAQVGSDGDPYLLQQVYSLKGLWNGATPKLAVNEQIANPALKPEITTGKEIGADIRLLSGRIGIDITYYDQITEDQILAVDISRSSGFKGRILNAGKITNEGVEASINGTVIKTGSLVWDASINFAKNKNQVVELAEGLNSLILWTQRGASLEARAGEAYGNLYGNKLARTEDGQLILRDGFPYNLPGQHTIGNITPDWTAGVFNSLTYKNITLGFLIDIKKGGDIYDMGSSLARINGITEESEAGREEGSIGVGVKNIGTEGDPVYVPNDVVVSTRTFMSYYSGRQFHEAAVMDGSYVKLREATITYDMPLKWFDNNFLESVSISLVGRNLAIFHKNIRHIDPEISSADLGFNYGQLPSTRSIGFNVNVKF